MNSSGWGGFWKDQKQSFNEVMKINTFFFARQIEELFHLTPTDEVLDYGCGPGFLADYLAEKDTSVTGADINTSFIEQNKRKHPASLHIPITSNTEENKTIFEKQLNEKKFDFIILLSIVQYFKNTAEINEVIKILLPYLKESGKIILADVIDPKTSSVSDAVSLLFRCIQKNRPGIFFRFMFYLLSSDYKKFSDKFKLLRVSGQSVYEIANSNQLFCKKLKGLTIHPSRTNYVFTRKNF